MEYAIETFSLTKIFSDWWGRDRVYAVDDLNLQIQYNEVFGLLGPNGSGKTTTLKILLGLLYPTKGKALCLGGETANPKISARIGFMPEESYLYRYLNARETLDFYGRLFGLPSKLRKMRIEALLDMVGLKAVANRPIGTFSKGMARRIALAQALINDPDLLMLDEPTTGLDPIGTRQIKDLIIHLAKRGKTILLCSHLLADVEDVCDRIAILYGGKIQSEGKVKELLQQTDKRQITTSSISDTAVEKIKQIVRNEQADCVVTSPMDKLETFFIRTVTEAQQLSTPTSGAISTTKIGHFLAPQDHPENILDKLVSTSVSPEVPSKPPATKQVEPVRTSEPKPDEQLLSKLTEQAESKPVVETKPVEPQAPRKEQVKKSILDNLTDHPLDQNADGKQTGKPQAGDSGNA
ncbi:MAG: ATP-binding cassette domain-containing protein [Phycisphaerae bacterium]|nr:ATP-binding cassette domain-containing protein [Phycisphaerae bacterium]MDD5381384.1 ATP-binding cassette domain-containing protein [Phycisphaerae bacterium]